MSGGRYEPVALIGVGGSCEIWIGVLEGAAGFRKTVVLKRASVSARADIKEARQMLVAEAHVSAALNHPNIIHVYELVDSPEGIMLAMEHLPGLSLRAIVSKLAKADIVLPEPVAVRIILDAARGLEYAHRAVDGAGKPLHIIHRDISPENLVVTEEGITKVVDFGIARSTLRDATTGLIVKGKLGYLSPEQARAQSLDWRSDVFSLGVVLYELLTSRPLFSRSNAGDTLEALLCDAIPPPPLTVNPVVKDVLRRMLVRDVAARQITMVEVADSLEASIAGRGGSHRDAAGFLRAEFADNLARRKVRLRELLQAPFVQRPKQGEMSDPGTMVLLESALDRTDPVGHQAVSDGDTVVQSGLEETLVERPLLGRRGRS